MNDYAYVEVTRHEVPHGRSYNTYKWIGARGGKVIITSWSLDYDMSALPWPTKVIDYDLMRDVYTLIRTDVHFWWLTWLRHKAGDALKWFSARLLATAQVWRLIDYVPGRMHSWHDLKILRRFRK
jgi:hypothetical protein